MSDTRSFDILCSKGLSARKHAETGLWDLWDLAVEVEAAYGTVGLDEFADMISVPRSELGSYKLTSGSFPDKSFRSFSHLSYCHFEEAAKTADPAFWIRHAQVNDLTVAELRVAHSAFGRPCDCCQKPLDESAIHQSGGDH